MLQNTTKQISYHYANPEQNRSIINTINNHDYEYLIRLLTPQLSEIIVINAIYATIHLTIADIYVDRQTLFNAHNRGTINIHNLTDLTYKPELEHHGSFVTHKYKSVSILNTIIEYITKYKLLTIDVKILHLLINKYHISNMFMFANYIITNIPEEYTQILEKVLTNNTNTKLTDIYKQLQGLFTDKLYNAIKSILNAGTALDQTLSILYQQLTVDYFKKHRDIQNILKKTLELLTINNIHDLEKQNGFSVNICEYNQEYLLLYSHYKLQQIVPEWADEPIENSRLHKIYKNYYKA